MLNITNEDCMDLMARYPDGHFDLAIVDPPYGLGDKLVTGGTWAKKWQSNGADGWQSQNPAWCMEWGKRKPPKDFTKCLWERPKTNQL